MIAHADQIDINKNIKYFDVAIYGQGFWSFKNNGR